MNVRRSELPARSAAPSPRARLEDLARRLQTPEGERLVERLHARLSPGLGDGLLEPTAGGPKDRFERAVVDELRSTYAPAARSKEEMSAALARAFSGVVGADGALSLREAERRFGPAGAAFLRSALAIGDPKQLDPMHDRKVLDRVGIPSIERALADVDVPKMVAIDNVLAEIARPGELEGFQFFGLQHLFLSSTGLFGALEELGVEPSDMRLLGKIYSTNFATAAFLRGKGAKVDEASHRLTRTDFESSMEASIENNLKALVETLPRPPEKSPKPQILLIDDGAEAIKLLHERYPEYAPYFVCVEQTRRGARILKELDLKCPVANVAETWAKLAMESPMIGHSVVLETVRKLERLESYGVHSGQSAVVLGYGAVGQAAAKALKERGFEVHVYDPSPERQRLAEAEGMVPHADKQAALPFAQTLVSCVGSRTLAGDDYAKLPDGAILINAASADDELGPSDLVPFGAKDMQRDADGELWGFFQGKAVHLGVGEATAHCDHVCRLPNGNEILLANRGFVINMTGERDPIPPRFIQLTRALLLLGALTARRAEGPGALDVPKEWQEKLVGWVKADLAATGESLEAPLWEARDGVPPIRLKTPPTNMAAYTTPRQLERERGERLAREARAEVKVAAELGRPPSPEGPSLYGFALGAPRERSKEAALLDTLGLPQGTAVTPQHVGLHLAVRDVARHFNTELRLRFDPSPKGEKVGGGFLVDDTDPKAEVDTIYARFVADLVRAQLARHHRTAPKPEQVARHLAQILRQGRVPAETVIDLLRAADDPELRKIGQATYRALFK